MAEPQKKDCVALTLEAARNQLAEGEVKLLVKELDAIAKRKKAAGELAGLEDEMQRVAEQLGNDAVMTSKIEKRNRLLNMMVERRMDEAVQRFTAKGLGYADALEAALVGTNKIVEGGRLSAEARQKEYGKRLVGTLLSTLKKKNVLQFFTDPRTEIEEKVAIELFEMDKPNGRVGITGNKQARDMAEAIHTAQEEARRLVNLAGANVQKMPGYIVRQAHDPRALIKAGRDEWKKFILPLLDVRKTFRGMGDIDKGLNEAYRRLTTGAEAFQNDEMNDGLVDFTGPGNLAKKLSESRVLHFKDGGTWHTYNKQYGRQFLNEAVLNGLERAGDNIGLLQTLGPNPEHMLNKLKDKYTRLSTMSDTPERRRDLNRLRSGKLEKFYKQISGGIHRVDDYTLAYTGSVVRAIQSTSKLGGAMISSIADLSTSASELRYQGKNLLQSYGDLFTERANLFKGADKEDFYDLLGVGMDSMIGGVAARFHANDMLPGTMSRLQQFFFKANGMTWWNNTWQKSVAAVMSRDLAKQANNPYAKLPDRQRQMMQLFGIGEKEWGLYSGMVRKFDDGREYMTPDLAADLTDDQIKKYLGGEPNAREIDRARDDLQAKLRAMIIDRVDYAIIRPDARTNAILNQGLERGTVAGEAIRMFMQFKAFPAAMLQKVWAREMYANGANSLQEALFRGKADMRGLAHLLVMSTVFGYAAMTAKDIFKGRQPRDPSNPETWTAAFLQGGGAGIYGDFLFGDVTRYGNSAWASIGGPTAGSIEDIFKLYNRARNGDDTAAKGLKFIQSHTPFANLFYLRPALDYMILYDLQEALNPGSLGRMEGYAKEFNNQEYFLKPTDRARPFTGG